MVALVVRVNKFEGDEWVIVRDVAVKGGLEKLPVSCAAVASVFSVSVFAGLVLVTVMLLALVKVARKWRAERSTKYRTTTAKIAKNSHFRTVPNQPSF